MNKKRNWMIGLTIVSLLAIGVVAVAGNGFGDSTARSNERQAASGSCTLQERDADGDRIPNSEDPDWAAPVDGSGYGRQTGYGRNLSANCLQDGSGYGIRQGGGHGQRGSAGECDGSPL